MQRASHSHSRTEGRGRGIPGWQAGGQGGRRHNSSGGEVWRRRVVRGLLETHQQLRQLRLPSHQAHSLAPAAPALLSPLGSTGGLLPLPGGTRQPPWGHG